MNAKTKSVIFKLLKVALVIAFFVGALLSTQQIPRNYTYANKYATSDVVYADGSTAHFEDKNCGMLSTGDVASIHLNLPEQPFYENSTLVFYDYNVVTEVWFGETLLESYGEDIAAKDMMIGNRYFLVTVPDEAWGDELTISVRATTDNALSNFTNLRIFPSEYAYSYFISVDPYGFVCSIALIIISLFGLLACILAGVRGSTLKNALCLIFTMLMASLWLIANEGIYTIFGFDGYFWQPMEYIAGYTIAIPLLLFYRGMTDKKTIWHRIFGIAAIVEAAFFTVATVLNFTGVLYYDTLMTPAGVLLIGSCILMLAYTILNGKDKSRAATMMRFGIYIFLPVGIYEALLRTVFKRLPLAGTFNYPPLLALGVMAFLLCLGCAFVSNLHEKQKGLMAAQTTAQNLSTVFNAIPTGIAQVLPDGDLTIVAANRIFYGILGYRDEELAKETPKDFYRNLYDNEKEFIQAKVREIVESGATEGEFELSTVDIDDKPLTVLVKYFCDQAGNKNITANIIDITDRKRMEEELRISEEDYRTAIEISDNLFFRYDAATGTCTHMFDSEELFGISEKVDNLPESLIELGLCAPESVDDYRRAFRMFDAGIKCGDFCLHLRNLKTHELRWYDGHFRTIFNADGTPRHAIASFTDITVQREKEIAYNIHKQQVEARPEDEIAYYELNLTTGMCDYSYGLETKKAADAPSSRWNDIVKYMAEILVCRDDRQATFDFLKCEHLMELHERGITNTSYEFRKEDAEGNKRWSRASLSIGSDSQTHEVKAYCAMEDIEEEKAAQLERQTALEKSQYYEEAYGKLSSSVMYGVCKYNADHDLTIVFANDIFYRMHGFVSKEEAEAVGFTSVLFATPPFGREIVRAAHREYMDAKAEQMFETEYRSVDADGKSIWILCKGIYSPTEGMFNSSLLDITDRKNAEEQQRVSEARYRLALSQSGKVFFFFDVPTKTMRLSKELAEMFGLPIEVDNMPDNFIAQGLVEEQSVANYRHFYERIFAGEETGDTIISCHMRQQPEKVLWYKIAFSTIFDEFGKPNSSIITYEDLSEQHENELESKWLQTDLLSVPEEEYVIADYNLTSGTLMKQRGALFEELPKFVNKYEDINNYVLSSFIYKEDVERYAEFLDRSRLLKLYDEGVTDDSIEYRSLQSGSTPRWTTTTVQFIKDSYSDDIYGRFLFMDIHDKKTGEMRAKEDVIKLKQELENNRIKVMINQMQPHFLYNALASIQMITKRDPDRAYGLMRDFTVHLRGSIKALSSDDPIQFSEELDNVRAYLNIELMRMENRLKVDYDIKCEDFSVVPLTIQPLVENAVKHGVFPKGKAGGTVTIRSSETPTSYVIEVEDDGMGFDADAVLSTNGDSYGLKNLVFRLKALMNADVTIKSEIDVGTRVTVEIPKGIEGEVKVESDNS